MSLLAHVLETCSDPDCEVHQIEVGLSEDTVTNADLAFFIAGAQAMYDNVQREFAALGRQDAQLTVNTALLNAIRPIMTLGSERDAQS